MINLYPYELPHFKGRIVEIAVQFPGNQLVSDERPMGVLVAAEEVHDGNWDMTVRHADGLLHVYHLQPCAVIAVEGCALSRRFNDPRFDDNYVRSITNMEFSNE